MNAPSERTCFLSFPRFCFLSLSTRLYGNTMSRKRNIFDLFVDDDSDILSDDRDDDPDFEVSPNQSTINRDVTDEEEEEADSDDRPRSRPITQPSTSRGRPTQTVRKTHNTPRCVQDPPVYGCLLL